MGSDSLQNRTYFVTVDWKCGAFGQTAIMVRVEMCEEISGDALDHPVAEGIDGKLRT